MKTKVTVKKETQWTRPGKLTQQEFMDDIHKAENGPFFTIDEIKESVAIWKKANDHK